MSLKFKISLLVFGLLVLTIGSFASVLIWNEKKALYENQKKQQMEMLGGLEEVCRAALIIHQDLLLTNYLKRLDDSAQVVEAMCLDHTGKIIGHTNTAEIDTIVPGFDKPVTKAPEIIFPDQSTLEARSCILIGGQFVGTARILFSQSQIQAHLDKNMSAARKRIFHLSLPILLLGLAAAFIITSLFIRPVNTLMNGARTIAAGKLDQKIPIKTHDEIGVLAKEFNLMADKLSELDQLKQDFVSSVTHDLKSPLSTISISLNLLKNEIDKIATQGADPAKMHDYVLQSGESAQKLSHLIFAMLDVAHIESGLKLNLKSINLEELADKIVRSFRIIAQQKNITLDLVVNSRLSLISVDEGKMERAISNLVSNAIKYTSQGSVIVEVEEKNGMQKLSVTDSGQGIPPESLDQLFSKFYRVPDYNKKKKAEGTGLGLAIVKGIVEAHNGSVHVESEIGKGSVFSITIPL